MLKLSLGRTPGNVERTGEGQREKIARKAKSYGINVSSKSPRKEKRNKNNLKGTQSNNLVKKQLEAKNLPQKSQ